MLKPEERQDMVYRRSPLLTDVTRPRMARWLNPVALWTVGGLALALVTPLGIWLGLRLDATAFGFLVVIVVLSFVDGLVSSLVLSVIAMASLAFFFAEPRFSLHIPNAGDLWRLTAFFISSIVITTLVRKLRRSAEMQRRQARLLDLSHDAIFACDKDDVIVYWNGGAEQLYGWKREEALGKVPYQLLQTEFPAPLEELDGILARTGHWDGELTHTKRDGSKIHVASRWSLQRDERGEPVGMLETNSDITEQKRAEDELRRSQATSLAEAQRLSHTGSFVYNLDSGEIFWSEEFYRIFGFDPSIKPSLALSLQRVHPDDAPFVRRMVRRASSGQRELVDYEHRLLMPGGTVKTVHVRAHALEGEPGKLQVVGALMDVTARTDAYAALEQSEQRYRRLFENMPIALWQCDTSALTALFNATQAADVTDFSAYLDAHPDVLPRAMELIVTKEVNDVAVRIFGAKDRHELLGPVTPLWQARPDTFRRVMESRFRGDTGFEEKTQLSTLDGRVIDVLYAVNRIGPGTAINGLVELTDLVRAEEKLQQLQAEFAHAARISVLGELMASIAHEVNQPLTALAANGAAGLRWLDRPEPNVSEASALMRNIVADARRAADIITRIRGMAAGQAPQQDLLSLHDVIDEALRFLRHELQVQRVTVSLDLAPALPQVIGDRTQLEQVIVNLAINAVQAMAQAGSTRRIIAVRTAPSEHDTLTCTLEDSGPGIAPEHLDRLFDSFFTTKEAGMGMGLSISRSIIEAHGGDLWADNGSRHGGARFSFTLPAVRRTS